MSEPVDPWTSSDDASTGPEAERYALSPLLHDALVAHLAGGQRPPSRRLRVSSHLKPDGCARQVVYEFADAPRDPPSLPQLLRFERGHSAGRLVVAALRAKGHDLRDEEAVPALRPSAAAWEDGHVDVRMVVQRHVWEVKAPGTDAWAQAGDNARRLVRDDYRFQLSRYFLDMQAAGLVDSASWVFIDWEGRHEPREVPLEGDLLVPLEEIVRIERERSLALLHVGEQPRAARVPLIEVRKGRARKVPVRDVRGVSVRARSCDLCSFVGTCAPGAEQEPFEPTHDQRQGAVALAEATWARDTSAPSPLVYTLEESLASANHPNNGAAPTAPAAGAVAPQPDQAPAAPTTTPEAAAPQTPEVEAPPLPSHITPVPLTAAAGASLSDPCPTCEGSGTSKGGGLACPDCLGTVPRAGFRPLGDGVRNPKLWPETLAEIRAREVESPAPATTGGPGW